MLVKRSFVLILALFIIAVLPVSAHANLVSSAPPANAQLDAVPKEIRLFFTEPLESEFSRIEIRNAQGQKLDMPAAEVDPNDDKQLVLIPSIMPDGVYSVAWRAVSQTDGHLTQGSFPILIGEGSIGDIKSVTEDTGIPLLSSIIRWYNLISLAWLVGSVAFWLFVWYPSIRESHPELEKLLRDSNWLAWLNVGLSSAVVLVLQAQTVSGASGFAILNYIPELMSTTRFGELWIVRAMLWASFGLIFWRKPLKRKPRMTILLLISALMLITQSLFSHASGADAAIPATLADWMHLLAMSVWIGGLIQFVLVIKPLLSTNRLAAMVARFSNMARVSVVMLIITGIYAAWLQVGSVNALLTTPYGQALIVKLLLFLPLLGIAGINLFFTHKGLKAGKEVWSKRLRYLVGVEIVLTIGILAAVGVMTAIVPARNQAALEEEAAATADNTKIETIDNTFFQMAYKDDLMILFTIEPGIVGKNTFNIDLFDVNTGAQITDVSLIRLRFQSKEQNTGQSELRIEGLTDGRYTVSGANLSSTGQWRIRMSIQRPDKFDTVIDFNPTISAATAAPPTVSFNFAPDANSTGTVLLIAGFAAVIVSGMFMVFIRPMGFNPQTIFTLVFGLCSLVLVQYGLELRSSTYLPNPIPANSQSVARGAMVYMRNCSPCHGADGLGDGPAAKNLDPKPANLAIHTAPGLHTDGVLFSWISYDASTISAMPAFQNVLSEQERWDVINFIRNFGKNGASSGG